jgi:hypothetical protein
MSFVPRIVELFHNLPTHSALRGPLAAALLGRDGGNGLNKQQKVVDRKFLWKHEAKTASLSDVAKDPLQNKYLSSQRVSTKQNKAKKRSRLIPELQDALIGFWYSQSSHVSGDRSSTRRLHINVRYSFDRLVNFSLL